MDPLQLITIGGAAGAFLYVLHLLATGKFHTHSEVEGLRADKTDLWKANRTLQSSLDAANRSLAEILSLLKEEQP